MTSTPITSGAVDENSPLLATQPTGFSTIFMSSPPTTSPTEMNIQPPNNQVHVVDHALPMTPESGEDGPSQHGPPSHPPPTTGPGFGGVAKADTDLSWGIPAGLHIRRFNDENLVIFRRAVGINSTLAGSTDPASLEAGRRKAVGIYAAALKAERRKKLISRLTAVLINACHFTQIIIGASLTALGPTAGDHVIVITLLGAINTVIAGVLALFKGQGLPDRLYHDQAEYRRLQDWIEQTEALLAVGVIGRDRKEVGILVQSAFKKYNAAKECEENNIPENYVRMPDTDSNGRRTPSPSPHRGTPNPGH